MTVPNEVILKAAPLGEASALDHIPEWFDTQWDLGNIRPVEGHVDGSDWVYLVVETPKGLELCQTGETIVLHDDGTLSVNHIPPRPKDGELIDWNELTKKWSQYWVDTPLGDKAIQTFVDEFWESQGGLDLYFDKTKSFGHVPRTHLRIRNSQ